MKNAIIMHDCVIHENAVLENVVADKDVTFGKGCLVGVNGENTPNRIYPKYLNTGISIFGKGACVPDNVSIGRNCVAFPLANDTHYTGTTVESGDSVGAEDA